MFNSFFLISLLIPIFAFIFEIYPRLLNKRFGVDIWTHLLYLKEYHKQERIPKEIKDGFLVAGDYDYPPLFILILSKFPFKLVEKYEFLFSPFFDFLLITSIFFISYFLTGNIYLSILTQAIYALTPIIILENSSATPRSLGYTLFTFLFIFLFFYTQNPKVIFFIIALLCGSLIFLSHRFTSQGFLFFSIFFSLFYKSWLYIDIFILSLILAIIISRGFYLKVLNGHIGNLYFWYKNVRYRFYHQVKGSYEEHKTKDFIFSLYNQFLRFPPFVLGITNPWTTFPIFVFLFREPLPPFYNNMLLLVVFSYTLALTTTWVPKLRFLGEGQRYLELSAMPSAFLSAKFLFDSFNTFYGQIFGIVFILVGLASFITIVVIQRKGIIKDELRTITPDMQKMFNYLKSLKIKPRILCIPHQITTNTIYHTNCPVFVNASYSTINLISDVYPYIHKPIRIIMKNHNLEEILLNEDYAKIKDLKVGKYTIIKRVNNFVLLKP